VSIALLLHIYLACWFISLSSIYLVLPLRSTWCACTVCRELVGTLGSPCGSPHQVGFVLELVEGFYLLLVLSV
jgi:hypothetical protein